MDDLDRFVDSRGRINKKMLHLRGLLSDMNLFEEDVRAEGLGGAPLREAKGFRAQGVLEDHLYTVGVFWGGEVGEQVVVRGWPHDREPLLELLRGHEGEDIPVAGTAETVVLHLNNPLAMRAALSHFGEVYDLGGDEPPGWPAGGVGQSAPYS